MKNKKSIKSIPVILHGEAMIFPAANLPANAKKIKTTQAHFHIIADSETTGNHHVVDVEDGVEFFMDADGHMFMTNESETQVRCVMENRHGTIPIPPGTWEFGMQQEYDHFAQHLRNVRD
jgi:hypothetical protein